MIADKPNNNVLRFLYVFTRAPYSDATGQEALDAVLMGAAFEREVSVLFMHDGVFQLKAQQNLNNSELKQYTKTFAALEDFDVENIYVADSSMLARGLDPSDLFIDTEVLDRDQIAALIRHQHRVFTF